MDAVPSNVRIPEPGILAIRWTDGGELWYGLDELRADCPCAPCQPSAEKPRMGRTAFHGIGLRGLEEVGNYALKLEFTDGHSTGIYTFERLRAAGHPAGAVPPPDLLPRFEV